MNTIKQEIELVKPEHLVSVTMSSHGLATALTDESKKRALIKTYIQENLVDGTDFGKIKMGNNYSKECLFKPGAEKVCSLLHLKPIFAIDKEVLPIVGEGIIPYICQLINRHSGDIEGEGRGSCSLKEKQGNANVAIKIAQKRAQIDAVLRVAALSDQFTQDLEDMQPKQTPAADEVDSFTHCPFGKNKGISWASMTDNSLIFYKDMFEKNLNDPDKQKFRAGTEIAFNGVCKELLNREGDNSPYFADEGDSHY